MLAVREVRPVNETLAYIYKSRLRKVRSRLWQWRRTRLNFVGEAIHGLPLINRRHLSRKTFSTEPSIEDISFVDPQKLGEFI